MGLAAAARAFRQSRGELFLADGAVDQRAIALVLPRERGGDDVGVGALRLAPRLADARDGPRVDRAHETVLGLHATDQGLHPHAGTLGDFGERDLVERLGLEGLERRVEDRLRPGLGGLGASALAIGASGGRLFHGKDVTVEYRPLSVRPPTPLFSV
jgi:hypothetical protein